MKLPRNVRMLGLVSFLTDASSEMIYPLLPVFLARVLGAGPAFLGLIEGVAEATASLTKLVSGVLSDRLGHRKPLVLAGYSLSTLSRPLIAIAQSPYHVLMIRFSDRVGKGVRSAPRDALIVESCPESDRGRAFGYQRAMDHAGAVVGPLMGFVAVSWLLLDLRTVFALAAIPGILAVVAIVKGVSESRGAAAPVGRMSLGWGGLPGSFKYYLFVIVVFTLSNSSDAFILLRAQDAGYGEGGILLLWSLLHVVKAASSGIGGTLSDRFGRKSLILTGWLAYAAAYAGFAVAGSAWQLAALFAFYGLYFGCTEGAERAMVADIVPGAQMRGRAYGLYHFAIGIAALPSSLIMGVLYSKFGPAVAFGAGAGLSFVAMLLLAPMKIGMRFK
ncbi:MAG: MFS transporter [Acidobacteria bacterium]|nr:MFS transporter [Acidobacteriota bacterium]